MKKDKKKNNGQVFTPPFMVSLMLNHCGYYNNELLLTKHIIDNSCGDGAFLIEVVKRFCDEMDERLDKFDISLLETYIHGIELDEELCTKTKKRLTDYVSSRYKIDGEIRWDVRCADALTCDDYNGKMDFVVGNPPYIRLHNLNEQCSNVRNYQFAKDGMTDIYFCFFEKGFRMLKDGGQLCYIAPSSWTYSASGKVMRQYLKHNDDGVRLIEYIDNGKQRIFPEVSTYSMVALFEKSGKSDNTVVFGEYDMNNNIVSYHDIWRTYEDSLIMRDERLFVGKMEELEIIKKLGETNSRKYKVCNGYATLSDTVFFSKNVPESDVTIDVIKPSTGEKMKGIFPYNKDGISLGKDEIPVEILNYLLERKSNMSAEMRNKEEFYLYGRTQAIRDTFRNKLTIGKLMNSDGVVKINEAPAGVGVYGGLYITTRDNNKLFTEEDTKYIKEKLTSNKFTTYIKALRKYKSGGYFTFSGKDVECFINQ